MRFELKAEQFSRDIGIKIIEQKMKKVFLIFALLVLVKNISAFPDGAPVAACFTLSPMHGGGQPQSGQPQVRMVISNTRIRPGQTISIRLESTNPNFQFRGFILQPRTVSAPNQPSGTMAAADANGRVINCSGLTTGTHTNREFKSAVVLNWTAPSTNVGVRLQ